MRMLYILVLSIWLAPAPAADNAWSRIGYPLPGLPQVIGSYNAGCLAGAAALPLLGEGYQVMRPSRNRYYGHPNLIAFIKRLGRQATARGERLLIGDLAQPRGGPMSYGHSSHQIGLDVDIWFALGPRERLLTPRETESLPMLSVVNAARGQVAPMRWSPRYGEILKLAVQDPEVERIFVNPIIKQALCASAGPDRAWLYKIRPWWGHDSHFHARLRCPVDSVQCKMQKPPPLGDGCDEDLERWVWEIQQAALAPPRPVRPTRPPVVLPVACTAVLNGYAGH